MRQYYLSLLLVFPLLLSGQVGSKTTQAINKFGLDAYAQLAKEDDILICPFSISSAMAMTYLGSTGETKRQIEQVFQFDDYPQFLEGFSELSNEFRNKDPETIIATANKLWPDKKRIQLNDLFVAENTYYFNTPVEAIDYGLPVESSNAINQWVAENTNDQITDLIAPDQISSDMILFLVNAVYFKSTWMNEFDPRLTDRGRFINEQQKPIEVDYMKGSGRYKVHENQHVEVLDLPYTNNSFSFLILLPKVSMDELELLLNPQNYFEWTYDTRHTQLNVLQIPKFKMRYNKELKNTLVKMGMPNAFGPAEFYKMGTANGRIHLSTVIHETYLDFNEEGTEATAATAVGAVARSMPPPPRDFIVDRPFIYIIRHNPTSTILFLGKSSNPTK